MALCGARLRGVGGAGGGGGGGAGGERGKERGGERGGCRIFQIVPLLHLLMASAIEIEVNVNTHSIFQPMEQK